jgi:hypothetical protein
MYKKMCLLVSHYFETYKPPNLKCLIYPKNSSYHHNIILFCCRRLHKELVPKSLLKVCSYYNCKGASFLCGWVHKKIIYSNHYLQLLPLHSLLTNEVLNYLVKENFFIKIYFKCFSYFSCMYV